MSDKIRKFLAAESGATVIEYGLLAGLIAVAILGTLSPFFGIGSKRVPNTTEGQYVETTPFEGNTLTNDPAIAMKAICSAEEDALDDEAAQDKADVIAMLREALGASPDTPVADLIRRAQAIIAAADSTRTDTTTLRPRRSLPAT